VLELEEEQRRKFLQETCSEDEDLRREVESLLAFGNDAERFMETGALQAAAGELAETKIGIQGSSELEERELEGRTVSHYEVLEKVGGGGMGIVYKARDTKLGRFVALKFLPAELSQDHQAIERFRREAYTASALNHPNICTIHDIDEYNGEPFIAMELLSGQTLKESIRDEPLPLHRILDLGIQVSRGLEAAHAQGIVHRDIKPANVFVLEDGTAKILDFGLAKLIRGGTETSATCSISSPVGLQDSVSSPGVFLGTLMYMSPEQLRGDELDLRTDLFSFSALLYEMATAVPPFSGASANEIKNAILYQAPTDLEQLNPRLPGELRRIVRKGLEKNREQRYQSASEMRTDLQRLKREAESGALHPRTVFSRRVATVVAGAALAIAIGAALVLGLNVRGIRDRLFVHNRVNSATLNASLPVRARRSVAVLGFKNLSGQPDKAWLSTAIGEMLTTELAAGEQLRTVPGENVSQMKINLSLPEAESYGLGTLAKIHANLNVDDLVIGAYTPLANGQIRLDLRLQDAVRGETLAAVSEKGTEGRVDDLVSRVGLALREKLGAGGLFGGQAAAVRATLPSKPEAARLYAEGLQRLRAFDVLGARDPLERAASAEPNHPMIHSALAEVWRRLGYNEEAKREAKKALDLSASLSREDHLLVEARYWEAAHERGKAVELYRTLFKLFPDNLDYGLGMAAAQNRAGKAKDASFTVEELRKMPSPARDDPRIDLAEDDAAYSLGEFQQGLNAALRAGAKAKVLGAPLLVATAQHDQCICLIDLGQYKEAYAACEKAQETFARTGDRDLGARVLLDVGLARENQGDMTAAQAAYEQALGIFREAGDKARTATVLNNLADLLSNRGDRVGALNLYNPSLRLFREIESKRGEAMALGNIATALEHIGRLNEATTKFDQTLVLDRAIGYQNHEAYGLAELGNTFYLRGNLSEAKKTLEQSLEICRRVDVGQICGNALEYLGEVLKSEGSLGEARTKQQEALAIREKIGLQLDAAESRLLLAELSIEEGHAGDVDSAVREARAAFQKQESTEQEIRADAVLAQALLGQNNPSAAFEEIDNIAAKVGKSQNRDIRLYSQVVASRVDAAMGKPALAERRLRAALAEAIRYGLVNRQLEARLALGEIEVKSGNAVDGRSLLHALERDAKTKGFLLIARKADDAAKEKG
jgi:serine/threonine protein kinase/tetratricopeptide (TPR) repeat protein